MDRAEAEKVFHEQLKGALDSGIEEAKLEERLREMIKYGRLLHEWYEDQRHRLLNIGLALLTLPVAICAVMVRVVDASLLTYWVRLFSAFAVVSLMVTGLLIVREYRRLLGANWPHREFVDIRSWFFIYTMNKDLPDTLCSAVGVRKQQVDEIGLYFAKTTKRWFEFAKERHRFLLEDFEQVFVLQLFQRYRRQSVKQMTNFLWWGLFAFFVSSAFAVFFWVQQL